MSASNVDDTNDNRNSNLSPQRNSNGYSKSDNNKNDSSNIIIKRSTFTKLAIVGVGALMVSAFLAGYNLRGGIFEGTTQTQLTTAIQALQNQPAPIVQQTAPTVPPGSEAFPAAAPVVNVSSIPTDGEAIKGKPNAPLTLVEYSDFQCPFCERFFIDTLPQLQKEYIDKGKLKLVYKQFPVESLHPNAEEASLASECANEQGKFWEYHDILFKNRTQWELQTNNQTLQSFKQFAFEIGVNGNEFNTCLDSKKYQHQVNKEKQEGMTFSVSGTPTFYVGNDKVGYTQIVGAQPFSTFQVMINQKLQESNNSTTTQA